MKNLLIYVNPGGFDPEFERLTKIQIDNSLELGWKPNDILLVTNFPYEYRGIRSMIVPIKKTYSTTKVDCSHKILTLIYLFDVGFIQDNLLYWYHDSDAYQLEPISEQELELEAVEAGFCDYGRITKWQMGSFFFKKSAEHIFRTIDRRMKSAYALGRPLNDENVMVELTNTNVDNINTKIKRLNGRYDFGMRRVDYCYAKAVKPLKILHFHPNSPLMNTLAIAMYGKNRINKPLMNKRLIKIFNKYGYR